MQAGRAARTRSMMSTARRRMTSSKCPGRGAPASGACQDPQYPAITAAAVPSCGQLQLVHRKRWGGADLRGYLVWSLQRRVLEEGALGNAPPAEERAMKR